MEQYPIPQFIEQEGKIVFFLTFRQFFLLVGGGFICILFWLVLPFTLFAIAAIVVMLVAAAIAFIKIDNVPIITVLLRFIGFSMGAKNYTWKRKEAPYPLKVRKKEAPSNTPESLPSTPLTLQSSKLKEAKKMVELTHTSTTNGK